MARYFAVLIAGFLATATAVAAIWFVAPLVVGERAPGGLLGMISGIGIIASMAAARRKLPAADAGDPGA